MVQTGTGLCWAALGNNRTQPHDEIDTAMNNHDLGDGSAAFPLGMPRAKASFACHQLFDRDDGGT